MLILQKYITKNIKFRSFLKTLLTLKIIKIFNKYKFKIKTVLEIS